MSAWLQVVVTLGGTAAFNAMLVAFLYGKLTQRVTDLVGWNKKQDDRLESHDGTLMRFQGEIAAIKAQAGMRHGG